MEEFIHQQNLARYRKMLSEKTHEPQRQTILQLLADEEADETRSASSIDE
jgi:hypothetical protein